MNYDGQQYTFSHGLATAPQLHLQQQLQQQQFQQQQFQQQQQIFQQQYSHPVPTSNIYQFQFTGGGGALNHIFQEKDGRQMGVVGGIQTRFAQHNLVPQPLVKQGLPVGIDVVGGLDALIYQQKNNLKIITNSDGRIMQQPDDAARMQQSLLGVDMMRNSNFIDQGMNAQQSQHQGISVAGHNMFAYGKHFSGWIQPQQINISAAAQCATGCQSSLPSFNHVWSPFQSQKQVDTLNQQQLNQYQQPQQFHNQLHPQQQNQMQTQIQFNSPTFQTASIQRIKPQQQNPPQTSLPVPLQTLSHPPQNINCFSPQSHHIPLRCVDKEIPNLDLDTSFVEAIPVSLQPNISTSCIQPLSSCIEHHPTTAVTYTISGPPKVTVTLDSLTHSESFPPNKFPGRQDVSFNPHTPSAHFLQGKIAKAPRSLQSSMLAENFHSQTQRDWQTSQNQRNSCFSKTLLHSSSTGSSLERSSSESSNFSSPPYIFTPPGSSDSIFSPVLTHFSKSTTDSSSSGRTSTLSSSSSSMSLSSSPPITLSLSSQPGNQYATSVVPTVTTTSSIASSTCTMTAATVVSSCSSVAITTTSVISTTTTPKENTGIAAGRSCMPAKKTGSCISENFCRSCSPTHRSSTACSPVQRPSSALPDAGMDKKVKVPYSWQRKFENGVIVYLSPSGVVLQSLDQICHYLLSDSTCKCGLECPIQLEKFFSFDPEVGSQTWSVCSAGEKLGNLCNHRREILALAAFRSSQTEAAVRPAGHGVWLGRKRERRKSINAGEGLIVTPFKKLKTRITNAVNRHAMSLGNGVPHTPPAMESFIDTPVDLDTGSLFQNSRHRTASSSPARYHEALGSCSNHGDVSSQAGSLSPGISDFQISQSGGDEKLCSGSVAMQNIGDQDRSKQDLYNVQKRQMVLTGNGVQHRTISSGDNHVFDSGNHRELIMNMQNQYPMTVGSHSHQHLMQYPQGNHPLQHQQQLINPGLCFPQNHLYPNIQQQQPQGFNPPVWQGSYPDNPASIPHHQHHHPSRSYPSVINFQHSSFNQPQPNATGQQPLDNKVQVDCTSAKSKRSKSKKQKQTNSIVDRSFPCSKVSARSAKTTVIPSTSASFFGNPIVFVEQQTAIINSSIALCQIPFSSPSPPHCDSSKQAVTFPPFKDNPPESAGKNFHKTPEHVRSESVEVQDKTESVHKEDDDDHKTGTDLESNKSFSDTMENNDSAYLSQTGSDQERSDMLDRLDSCLEMKPTSDVYNYSSVQGRDVKQNVAVNHGDTKSNQCSINTTPSRHAPKNIIKKQQQEYNLVTNKISNIVVNKKITKSKPRQKAVTRVQDRDLLAKTVAGNLNGDLSQLLASNNWNNHALQQVLANYSGDPGQLNAAVQQVQSLTNAGLDFPASTLLSAAARAQLNLKQKEQISASAQNGKNSMLQNLKIEVLPPPVISSTAMSDLKTGVVSTAFCGNTVSPAVTQQQLQPSFQPVTGGASLIGNMMQFQQFPSASFAMNMLIPSNGQGHLYAADALNSGTFNADSDIKTGQGAINPLMGQGILATVSQTGDINSQMKLSVASVIPSSLGSSVALPSSLGPSVAQGAADSNTMLLNSFGPGMIMNAPMPPVSVSVVTNVTKSLAQVVPTIGINQTIFGAQQVAQHLLNSHSNGPQIINTLPATPGTHMISTSPQAAQLITTTPQGAHFVNPTAQRPQVINSTPHSTQIMNALSVGGFNNQLLITNPVQQISPSSSLSQLSPAMATQILAQGHHLPQISPSYLQNQILKQSQSSVIGTQNIYANVSLPTLTVTSDSTNAITGPIAQAGIINNNLQKNHRVCDGLDKVGLANTISQIPDTNSSMANSSVYATTSQPLFVIPQPNPNPMMQMLGSAQTLNTTSGMPADLNISQGNISQMFGQSATVDQSGIQNLLAAGCNSLAIQQMMNSISLSGVQQQQQQQLQLLQLQQLMLQQLQNQGQNIQGISLPLNQTSNPGQATAIGTPTIVSTLMPQTGLQLNSLMDINSLHPCLSPVAQGYPNQLSPAAAPLQHISSALAVQQVTHVNSCGAVSVVQSGGMQNMMQIPAKHLQTGHTLQQQQLPPNQFQCGSYENVLRLHGCNINRSLI